MSIKIKIKKKLLKLLLEDDEVKQAIRNVFNENNKIENEEKTIDSNRDKEIEELKKEIEMLNGFREKYEKFKKCFSDEKKKNTQLSENLSSKDEELQQLLEVKSKLNEEIEESKRKKEVILKGVKELEVKLNDSKEETKKYKEPFKEQLKVYDLYHRLSQTTKSSLKGIFKDDSLIGFFACGVQEKNIDSFWEYTKNEIIEEKNSDVKNLIVIFNFLFERYLMAYPMYVVQEIQIGEEFKTEKHIKDSQSSVSGAISKVLLRGWVNSKNSKIVKKSVVRV
jgi:DNA repair exonuclease SbcCD ATPase subunit